MFGTSGALLVLALAAFWGAVDAGRVRRWGTCAGATGAGLALCAIGGGVFWLGVTNPNFNYRRNLEFPRNVTCLFLGARSAGFCFPDQPSAPGGPDAVAR